MKNFNKKNNNHNGFSVIELIIIILIISILSALALPSVQRNLQLFRLETGSGSISSLLALARMEAIKRNREVTVVINEDKKTAILKSKNHRNEEVSLTENIRLSDDISFLTTGNNSVTFTSLGRNKTSGESNLYIRLIGTNKQRRIKVSSVGQISAGSY